MSADSFIAALSQTSLSSLVAWSQLDLERLLLTAERHGLDPVGREVFLLPGGPDPLEPAVVAVGVDGWSRILNSHEQFAGMSFRESRERVGGVPAWVECTIHRWDRRVPTSVREYLEEARGASMAWVSHPRRMLRHKSMVQCARVAFGLVGVYDADEAHSAGTTADHRPQATQGSGGDHAPGPRRGNTCRPMGVHEVKNLLHGLGAWGPNQWPGSDGAGSTTKRTDSHLEGSVVSRVTPRSS
jgi:hypothetical protein